MVQKRIEKHACDSLPNLAALSSRQVREMEEHYGCGRKKVRVVPCGIDTSLFSPKHRLGARKMLGFPVYGQLVLACARWSVNHKGFDILLRLAARLPENALLVVNGPTTPTLRKMFLPNMVERTTLLSDMPYLYSAADVFVHPSRYEGFGLVTAEALACGTPSVAFDTGAAVDLIKGSRGGTVLGDIWDVDGFVEASLSLLGQKKAAKPDYEFVRKNFSSEGMARNYLAFYSDVVGGRG